MKAIDRKAVRDLRVLWSQALTIALVVASGVGAFLATLSAVDSLASARDRFYVTGRFADVFVTAKRAPQEVARRLREIPGVLDVQTTVEAPARVTVSGSTDPVIGQLVGVGAREPRRLNRLVLRSGRWPEPGTHAGGELQVLASESFAKAHALHAGDAVTALVNARQRTLRITGTALSPEHIFGGLMGVPDLRAFGVFWLDEDELSAAVDMEGAFSHASLKLAPGASEPMVIDAATRLLARFGGAPAHGRDSQPSHAMLDNEIREQHVLGSVVPSIFLAVAGFLLHVVTARLVAAQREQVAALKALGYANRAIALHYVKLVLPMVIGGYLAGLLLGSVMGAGIMRLYTDFFRFPEFDHHIPPGLALAALGIVLLTALLGTLSAIAATVRLSPAEAMRPPAPGRYRRALLERIPVRVGTSVRMIARNIERRPLRAAVTTGGIAAAVAIVIMGNFFRDAIDAIVHTQFDLALRGDVVVWNVDVVDAGAARELARLPGVLQVEAGRRIAVRFRHGWRAEDGLIDGRAAQPLLQRVIDVDGRHVPAGTHGIVMTDRLADKLGLRPGDTVDVEVREGRRAVVRVVVERTVRDMMGLNAFMRRESLNRLLAEGNVANNFALRVERGMLARVLESTQALPKVAGAFSKATMLRNMNEVSARNILIMSAVLTAFAVVIAVGVVYNNARIALAERTWELASLRVLGFTRTEVSMLLLGELALVIAVALPLGMMLGWGLTNAIAQMLRSDQFLFPVVIRPPTYAWAAIAVVAAGLASALVVRRRIDRLDMVAALKTRE
ncbi:ABC transporter permease [Variovorax sp. JS1663]|nr:ABC transporter permease [Variovorax sp. JS1663]